MSAFADTPVQVIGGGLAGAEACWQLARRGVRSVLFEMRPETPTPAHRTRKLAELVGSNSGRSDDAEHNAVGLLQEAMRRAEERIRMRASDMDLERAVASLRRSQARLRVAQRRRTRPTAPPGG